MQKARPDETESLCPVCLKRIRAQRVDQAGDTFLVKECSEHGIFRTVLWRGEPSMAAWQRPKAPAHPYHCYTQADKGCPFDCGLCDVHRQIPCSVLLEVTDRCNLRCAVCFADAGGAESEEPSVERISWLLGRSIAAAGPSNLQLSGGEPTLRDDLPEIVEAARRAGYTFIQINTNGIRLAAEKGYAQRLADAGLVSVFLQFDGVDDETYRRLRGRALLDEKLRAIENCGAAGLGVVLVPTVVKGVNSGAVGAIVERGVRLAPVVRGIHFQPVSYFGRFPAWNGDEARVTLPELMRSLEAQTGGLVSVGDFSPPGCEHAHCSFHATYIRSADGRLRPIGAANEGTCCAGPFESGGVKRTVETVSRRWSLPAPKPLLNVGPPPDAPCCGGADIIQIDGALDLDLFLQEAAARSFTISAMAFQDAANLDLERLRGCCISVVSPDGLLIPFCAYNLTDTNGNGLYRKKGPLS
jgi:uncharacterized radical SAM superfamily Fe-S cluster-containing enzyme